MSLFLITFVTFFVLSHSSSALPNKPPVLETGFVHGELPKENHIFESDINGQLPILSRNIRATKEISCEELDVQKPDIQLHSQKPPVLETGFVHGELPKENHIFESDINEQLPILSRNIRATKEISCDELDVQKPDVQLHSQKDFERSIKDNYCSRKRCLDVFCTYDGPFPFYPTIEEINDWIMDRARRNTALSVKTIGTTVHGRPLRLVTINKNRRHPVVFIESGIHGREWITPATAIYMIQKILKRASARVMKKFEFQFLVNANPDGYAYTHSEPTLAHRLWRKNRRHFSGNCTGVDLNRNFDIDFGRHGVAKECWSNYYGGPHAFSEKETQAVRRHIMKNRRRIKFYLSLHSYSQMVLVPYFYKKEKPKNFDELMKLATIARNAIKKASGADYTITTIANTTEFSGSSSDWSHKVAGIPLSLLFELRPTPSRNETFGFLPPTSFIFPCGEEIFAALIKMLRTIF